MKTWQGFFLVPSLALSGCEEPPLQAYGRLDIRIREAQANIARIEALHGVPDIVSLIRLGSKLRAQIPKRVPGPSAIVARAPRRTGIAAEVDRAFPDIEDIFVAVTELREARSEGRGAAGS